MNDQYQTIARASAGTFKDKGSKFLGFAFAVTDEEQAKKHLQEVKKEHYQCNHHCYALRLKPDGSFQKSSDDREPSGSAGKPIMGILLSHELTDTLIIVARYFGGTQLGIPGLINAYKSAAADSIANAGVLKKTVNSTLLLSLPYECVNELMTILKTEPVQLLKQEYNDPAELQVEIRMSREEFLLQKLKNNYHLYNQLTIKIEH